MGWKRREEGWKSGGVEIGWMEESVRVKGVWNRRRRRKGKEEAQEQWIGKLKMGVMAGGDGEGDG